MAPPCRYEAGLAQARHVAMQPHGLPVNQPVRQPASQPARHTVRQPAQPARPQATLPANHPRPGSNDRLARPGWAPAMSPRRPASWPASRRRQPEGQTIRPASQPDTKLQPAGWPAGRLAGQRPQPASQAGLMGWVSRAGQATPGWRWPDRWPVVPNFGCPGTLVKPEKNSIQGGSVLIRELGPETWDHLC